MKKLSIFFAALAISAMAMAAGPKVTLDFSSKSNPWNFPTDAALDSASFTYGGQTISLVGSSDGKTGYKLNTYDTTHIALIVGKLNAKLYLPIFDFPVSKIVCYGNTSSSSKVTFNVFVNGTAICAQATSSLVDHSFDIPAASQTKGTAYCIKVTNANNAQFSKIEIYEAVAGAPANPQFSISAGTYTSAQSVELTCDTIGASIYYTTDCTEPSATSTLYTAAISVTEPTTIKAVAIKNAKASSVVSAHYNVVTCEGDGTKTNPFTVADMIKLSSPKDTAWVMGTIAGVYNNSKFVPAAPFTNASNLLLATANDTVVVQLVNGSAVRTALNLVDNAGKLGAVVKLRGALESYCTTNGLKGTNDYEIVSLPTQLMQIAEKAGIKKMMMNGQMVIIREGKMFNALGAEL